MSAWKSGNTVMHLANMEQQCQLAKKEEEQRKGKEEEKRITELFKCQDCTCPEYNCRLVPRDSEARMWYFKGRYRINDEKMWMFWCNRCQLGSFRKIDDVEKYFRLYPDAKWWESGVFLFNKMKKRELQ